MINKLYVVYNGSGAGGNEPVNDTNMYIRKTTVDKQMVEIPSLNPGQQNVTKNKQNVLTRSTMTGMNEEKLKQLELNRQKLKLSICENISLIICRYCLYNGPNFPLPRKGKFLIENNTNIVNIKKAFEELKMIKNTLFDKNGVCVMNFMMQ